MNPVFRLSTSCRNFAILVLPFFLAMMGMSTYMLLGEGEVLFAAVAGSFWAFWVGLSLWLLLSYYRERLSIRNEGVTYRGILRTISIDFAELVELRWKPRGVAVLRSPGKRIAIGISNYATEQQKIIIRSLRRAVPASMQKGWDRFCYVFAMHYWDCPEKQNLSPAEIQRARHRCDLFYVSVILLMTGLGVGFSWYLSQARWLLFPTPFIVLWFLSRAMLSKTKYVSPWLSMRQQSAEQTWRYLRWRMPLWSVPILVAAILAEALKTRLPIVDSLQIFLLPLLFGFMLWGIYRAERNQRLADQASEKLAAQEWDRLEGGVR